MNFPDHLFPVAWEWAAHGLFALILGYTLLKAPWQRLRDPAQQHVFLGTIVALLFLWGMRAGVKPGLGLHFIGATAATLMFGPELAFAALTVVLAASTLAGWSGWASFSLGGLLLVTVPVLVSHGIYALVDSKLPNHFFVYVFLDAFFGAVLAMLASGVALAGALSLAGVYAFDYLAREYLLYFVLLAWGEALMTGMAITLMVVYRPGWVSTFDDSRYLRNK